MEDLRKSWKCRCRPQGYGAGRTDRLPGRWIFTDEKRLSDPAHLPLADGHVGLVIRHYAHGDRAAIAAAFRDAARARGWTVLLALAWSGDGPGGGAGAWRLAQRLGVDGLHLPGHALKRAPVWRRSVRPGWIVTAAVHDRAAARRAEALSLNGIFVSPVFATRSHPGAPALGPFAAAALARAFSGPCFALGGLTDGRFRRLKPLGLAGWAAIDAWREGPFNAP